MKEINFINPLPPKQQQAIRQWLRISSMLTVGLTLCMLLYTAKQLYILYTIRQAHSLHANDANAFNKVMERKQQLKKQEQTLKEHVAFIQSFSTSKITEYLDYIYKACNSGAHIQSCVIQSNNFELVIACANTQQATKLLQQLAQPSYMQDLKLVSLQPKQHGSASLLHVSIKGTIKA